MVIVLSIAFVLVVVATVIVTNGTRNYEMQRHTSVSTEIRQKQVSIADQILKNFSDSYLSSLSNGGAIAPSTVSLQTSIQSYLQQQLNLANTGTATSINGNLVNPTSSVATVAITQLTTQPYSTYPTDIGTALSEPWATLTFPNIRWGFKAPGASFIGKAFGYNITTTYQQTDNTTDTLSPLHPPTTTQYLLEIYEIPAQTAITGDNIIVGQEASGSPDNLIVSGGVVANSVLIDGSAKISNNVAAVNNLTWNAGAQIGGHTLSTARSGLDNYNYLETLTQEGLITSNHEISVATEGSKILLVPLGNRALRAAQADVSTFYLSPNSTPTDSNAIGTDNYSVYCYPYFATGVRIQCRNATITAASAGPPAVSADASMVVTVTTYHTNSLSARTTPIGTETYTLDAVNGSSCTWMKLVNSPDTNDCMLEIDPNAAQTDPLIKSLSTNENDTFYVDLTDATGSRAAYGVGFYNAATINTPGLSLVTPNTAILNNELNDNAVPFSVLAPHVAYSLGSSTPGSMNYTGQRGIVTEGSTTAVPITNFKTFSGTSIPLAAKTVTLNDTSALTPANIPPIVPRDWLVTCQEVVPGG